ncbi:MAG TPA: zinc ribbon domain-containing protein [Thermoanaerobaculia bacterium]|nr:zinc ribbon domain-containing protein [Thermoanaerobaculia bacterium]
MPIYEFYCQDCNTLFNFFSAKVDTVTRPACPRCGRERLERRPARFATLSHGKHQDDPLSALDEGRLESVMESMTGDLEALDEGAEEDPKVMAALFRRFGEAAGLEPGSKMQEFLARLESGEDPERLEEEMGSAFDEEGDIAELFRLKEKAARMARDRPKVDETLYFL